MKILAFLFLLLSSPAWACVPFVPAIQQAQIAYPIVELTLSGDDAPLFLKINFNYDSKATTVMVLIDPTDGEILVAGAIGPCVEGHAKKPTSSLEAARIVVGQWLKNMEDAKKLKEDRGKT